MNNQLRNKLIYPAITGALYASLTMLLSPISYGPLQFRLSEALCVLPFWCPYTAIGLAVGCAIANTLSSAGILDVILGSLATLLAGACTAAFGRNARLGQPATKKAKLLACLMPVLWNALIIGAVLAKAFTPTAFWHGFLINAIQIGVGELVILFLPGLALLNILPKILHISSSTEGKIHGK